RARPPRTTPFPYTTLFRSPDARAERTGPGEQEVPGQDRHIVPPQEVRAVGPTPGGGRVHHVIVVQAGKMRQLDQHRGVQDLFSIDRKSTRLNSSHVSISYA